MPSRAAADIAATIAVGVARISAAGAGDYENGNGLIYVSREKQDDARNHQNGRRVPFNVAVDNPHNGYFCLLGLQNKRLDLAQGGIFAGLCDGDIESAGEVARAREYLHTGDFVNGQGLRR